MLVSITLISRESNVYSNLRLTAYSERYQMCAVSNILIWKNGELKLTTRLGCQRLVMHPVYPRMLFFLSSFDVACVMEQSFLNIISIKTAVSWRPTNQQILVGVRSVGKVRSFM